MFRLRSWFARPSMRVVLFFALLGIGLLVVPFPTTQHPITRHLTLNATQFEFAPGRVEVNQGDTVAIDIMATGSTSGWSRALPNTSRLWRIRRASFVTAAPSVVETCIPS